MRMCYPQGYNPRLRFRKNDKSSDEDQDLFKNLGILGRYRRVPHRKCSIAERCTGEAWSEHKKASSALIGITVLRPIFRTGPSRFSLVKFWTVLGDTLNKCAASRILTASLTLFTSISFAPSNAGYGRGVQHVSEFEVLRRDLTQVIAVDKVISCESEVWRSANRRTTCPFCLY